MADPNIYSVKEKNIIQHPNGTVTVKFWEYKDK